MKPLTKAIIVALIHLMLVCSLGGKLLYDRHTRPRAWFKVQPYDPSLPIRGRYLSMRLELNDSPKPDEVGRAFDSELRALQREMERYPNMRAWGRPFGMACGSIEVQNGAPVVVYDKNPIWPCDNLQFEWIKRGDDISPVLYELVLFFISDTADDPRWRQPGQELWVLATIPRKGPPRPIELGIKKSGEKEIRPLDIR